MEVGQGRQQGVQRRPELLRRDAPPVDLLLVEPLPLLLHRHHELVEQDRVHHAHQADARHKEGQEEEERHQPVHGRRRAPTPVGPTRRRRGRPRRRHHLRRIRREGQGRAPVGSADGGRRRGLGGGVVVADEGPDDIGDPAVADADLEHAEEGQAEIACGGRRVLIL